ncbi:Dcp1p-Dcp2p decapping enzyme complex alpha subunit [Coemansia sp. RSA 2598]|nr:Dcp1p-Dcp2p decapping enzyme complex alpha subunit [Coemansia sp. RSA 2598]
MFPGSQPVSFTKSHSIPALQSADYLVCEKSDGVRVLLLLLLQAHGQAAFLITRKNKYHYIEDMLFPAATAGTYHHNTLIDAELVIDREKDGSEVTRLLCFDALCINGQPCVRQPLRRRLALLENEVVRPFQRRAKGRGATMPGLFDVAMKQFQPSYTAEHIYRDVIPTLGHQSDGLIFTSCAAPYIPGTCDYIIKWKPASENSVDLVARVVPAANDGGHEGVPDVHLYAWKGGDRYEYFSMLAVTDSEWTEHLSGIQLDGAVVEVFRDRNHRPPAEWRFMRVRDDKANGNHASVLVKILHSIDDGVELAELADAMALAKENWEARSAGPVVGGPLDQRITL